MAVGKKKEKTVVFTPTSLRAVNIKKKMQLLEKKIE